MTDQNFIGGSFNIEAHQNPPKRNLKKLKMWSDRSRNPSKNTIKRIMRRAWLVGSRYAIPDDQSRFLHNEIAERVYIVSKGKICNIEPNGYTKCLNI